MRSPVFASLFIRSGAGNERARDGNIILPPLQNVLLANVSGVLGHKWDAHQHLLPPPRLRNGEEKAGKLDKPGAGAGADTVRRGLLGTAGALHSQSHGCG